MTTLAENGGFEQANMTINITNAGKLTVFINSAVLTLLLVIFCCVQLARGDTSSDWKSTLTYIIAVWVGAGMAVLQHATGIGNLASVTSFIKPKTQAKERGECDKDGIGLESNDETTTDKNTTDETTTTNVVIKGPATTPLNMSNVAKLVLFIMAALLCDLLAVFSCFMIVKNDPTNSWTSTLCGIITLWVGAGISLLEQLGGVTPIAPAPIITITPLKTSQNKTRPPPNTTTTPTKLPKSTNVPRASTSTAGREPPDAAVARDIETADDTDIEKKHHHHKHFNNYITPGEYNE